MEEQAKSIDDLPIELWKLIFRLVPHVNRIQCRCVSQKWYRFLKDLEEDPEEAIPRSSHYLFLCSRSLEREWKASDTSSNRSTKMKLPWPPGWNPAVHGGIQRAGPGLVALWDTQAWQYFVGNPVHDKWEKVPGPPHQFEELPSHRRGFHFIPEGPQVKREFLLEPAVPIFEPVQKLPSEDECFRKELCGFYHIVQFQVHETHERWPRSRFEWEYAKWAIQVYSSRSRSWRRREWKAPEIRSLILSCVSGNSVYFLAALKPPDAQRHKYIDDKLACPLEVWVYRLDTDSLSLKVQHKGSNANFQTYWRSIQLRVTEAGDVSMIFLGYPRGGIRDVTDWSNYKLVVVTKPSGLESPWETQQIGIPELIDPRLCHTRLNQLIDPRSGDFMALNLTEGPLAHLYGFAHVFRDTMYTTEEYLHAAAEKVTGQSIVLGFTGRQWMISGYNAPLCYDGVLPVVSFLPCCSLPCCAAPRIT